MRAIGVILASLGTLVVSVNFAHALTCSVAVSKCTVTDWGVHDASEIGFNAFTTASGTFEDVYTFIVSGDLSVTATANNGGPFNIDSGKVELFGDTIPDDNY